MKGTPRYIDANWLDERVKELKAEVVALAGGEPSPLFYIDERSVPEWVKNLASDATRNGWAMDHLRELIAIAPTANVAPVRHGHWLVGDPYMCSVCEKMADDTTPYCPNCGARMEQEEEK